MQPSYVIFPREASFAHGSRPASVGVHWALLSASNRRMGITVALLGKTEGMSARREVNRRRAYDRLVAARSRVAACEPMPWDSNRSA